ncbi:AraC family transcriptional regulator [Mariniphaga sediminis]|jgi:AraC-like DNA-binding protein|uniref:AraC family transcriptional regulator n=1 Tax=Mariniphaga sediminis TaxID=1628158 RepID=A0A399CZJ6_9BACT|nr:AraC family transcriptional regulator [Mariniphaga sediminis]RIH63912.1 AraC family transcriptional regulator [Mariniphaga sediminis]
MNETFKIYPVSVEEAKKINASVNEPHQHDYEELIIGIEGQLEHFIDFDSTRTDSPYASFITKGKVHRVQPRLKNELFFAWVIRFQSEFIPEIIFQLYGFYHNQANIEFERGTCFDRVNTLCEMMYLEYQQENPDLAIIRHLLQAVFIMIESQRKKILPDTEGLLKTQSQTFKNFLAVLEENFRRPAGVSFYAEKLFMTPRNLNVICQNILQQSVSEIIETRKLTEAKNMLITTDLTIAEIGFELGYNEKSYFTNVFKKKTGQSPSAFRTSMKKLFS